MKMETVKYSGDASPAFEKPSLFPKISPIIPVRHRDLFESSEWLYEVKHDGYRTLAYVDAGRCRFVSRHGNQMKRFRNLPDLIAKDLKVKQAVLDGEIFALDEADRAALYDLINRQRHAVCYRFDIFCLNERDLRELSLVECKKILRTVIPRK